MKTFLLFLLTSAYFSSGPSAVVTASHSEECKLQHVLLKEIIEDVNGMERKQYPQILVENVITPDRCTRENFCKAGEVLSEYKAEDLGLKDKDWRLPRTLVAYTRKTPCNVEATAEQVEFQQLLLNIKHCAQKEYKKNMC